MPVEDLLSQLLKVVLVLHSNITNSRVLLVITSFIKPFFSNISKHLSCIHLFSIISSIIHLVFILNCIKFLFILSIINLIFILNNI